MRTHLAILAVVCAAAPAAAQTARALADSAATVADGEVRMSFSARPGVCGNGRGTINVRSDDDDWVSDCEGGPVRVIVRRERGQTVDVDTYVGGRWRPGSGRVLDLGMVPAPAAAEYLIALRIKGAILPATLADSAREIVVPGLLSLAKDSDAGTGVRRQAVFWLGQAAGDAATKDLVGLVDDPDRDVKNQAVFALSQLPHHAGVEALIRIARSHPDPEVRRKAIFWLGQSNDPRALALFEQILTH